MAVRKTPLRLTGRAGARALAVLDLLDQAVAWEPFTGPTGAHLWRIPGSGHAVYTVSRTSCTCPYDTFVSGGPCKHIAALAIYLKLLRAARTHQQIGRPPAPPPEHPSTGAPR